MMQSTLPMLAISALPSVFVPEHAPVAAIGLLAAAGAVLAALLAAAVSLAARRGSLALRFGAAGLTAALAYAGLLAGCALTSSERVLPPGGRKYFCELDCHLAYSLAGVEHAGDVGASPFAVSARGRFTIVRVRTWFDPSSIASFRGNAPLTPNPREAWLVDDAGRKTLPSAAATRAFEESAANFFPFSRPLSPGESYETALVFDVAAAARPVRLFVGDPPGVERVLLGHENSPRHGKVWFALPG